jgi:hypothetical protein
MTHDPLRSADEPKDLSAAADGPIDIDPVTRIGTGGGVNVPQGIQPPDEPRG